MKRTLITCVIAVVLFTAVFGLVYPLLFTGVSQVVFPGASNGSKIERDGKLVGSKLIAQDFRKPVLGPNGKPKMDKEGNPVMVADPRYFQPRPSQTTYSPSTTFFSNLGPNSTDAQAEVKANMDAYLALERRYDPTLTVRGIPADAVRHLPMATVNKLIADHTDGRFLGVFGEPGVNVLELNLALDGQGR